MTLIEEENKALESLLVCSKENDVFERSVFVCSWDELSSWRKVAPMCVYFKRKRKKVGGKKRIQQYLDGDIFNDLQQPHTELNPLNKERKNLLYCSTGVLSYDCPSSRDIVDKRTYSYIDRERNQSNYSPVLSWKGPFKGVTSSSEEASSPSHGYTLPTINSVFLGRPYAIDCNNEFSHLQRKRSSPLKPISFIDQVKFTNGNGNSNGKVVPLDEHVCTALETKSVFKSKTPLVERFHNAAYSKNNNNNNNEKKALRAKQYDSDLMKIQTFCLPPVRNNRRRRRRRHGYDKHHHHACVDDESEGDDDDDEHDGFPFRISRICDGRQVFQGLDVNNMTVANKEQASDNC